VLGDTISDKNSFLAKEQKSDKKENKHYSKEEIAHRIYSTIMFIAIVVSLAPLTVRETNETLVAIDFYCVLIFIFDYLIRWLYAVESNSGNKLKAFLRYPFKIMAIIDLLSILPTFTPLSNTFTILRVSRLVKTIRIIKITRTSKELCMFFEVIAQRGKILLSIFGLVVVYIVFAALLMYNVDTTFNTFLDAVYWVATSNNDIIPHSRLAQIISMLSSVIGVSVISLPSCIITASYINKLKEVNGITDKTEDNKTKSNKNSIDE
jgi:voltage-gated potassium channel